MTCRSILVDAWIKPLESSRVVVHAEQERAYHVFYEMLAGLSDEKVKEFQLDRSGCQLHVVVVLEFRRHPRGPAAVLGVDQTSLTCGSNHFMRSSTLVDA